MMSISQHALNLAPEDTPFYKLIHDTYFKTTEADLEADYFKEWGNATKWKCFSDYSLDAKKPNSVITFSFIPHVAHVDILSNAIRSLAPAELKRTSKPNPAFISFIRQSPFLNFSIILSNHEFLFQRNKKEMKEAFIFSLERMQKSIPGWDKQNPHMKAQNQAFYNQLEEIKRLVKADKKITLLKNLFIITAIGSFLSMIICNRTNAEIMGWFSDRDSIHDIGNQFAIELFHVQFIQLLKNFPNCQFVAAPASCIDDEWYKEIIKVPDYITGALADLSRSTNEISHEKFRPILKDLIADNKRNIFVYHLNFNNEEGRPVCSRIQYFKDRN